MSDETDRRPEDWPGWLEPLRPLPEARWRLRREILAAAEPALVRCRRDAVWEMAAGWAERLVPLAAAAALLLTWLVSSLEEAPAPEVPDAMALDEAAELGDPDGLPAMLTSQNAPSQDRVLQAVVFEEAR